MRCHVLICLITSLSFPSGCGGEEHGAQIAVEPYRVEEHRFDSGDISLFGKLHLPPEEGRYPAIVIVHGSARDGYDFQYMRLSQIFAEHGVATLFFDKRGTGQSEGEYTETPPTMDYYTDDVIAAATWLKTQEKVDPETVGLWGHSQGGWIAPYAAVKSDHIAFVIAASGPAVSPLEQIAHQRARELEREHGLTEEQWRAAERLRMIAYRYWAAGEHYETSAAEYAELATAGWFQFVGWPEQLPRLEELGEGSRAFFAKKSLQYDPIPVLEEIGVPTLLVYGANDWQIPVEASLKALEPALAKNPNKDITVRVFEGTGHGIMVRGDDDRRYFREGYVELMLNWLDERVGLTRSP